MKLPPWSHTFLRDYQNCQHKSFRRFVLRDLPFESTEAMEEGKRVHEALARRIGKGTPLPGSMRGYEPVCSLFDGRVCYTELKLGIDRSRLSCGFFDDQVYGRGIIDLAVIDRERRRAMLVDWKTGKPREDNLELKLQAVLLAARYPYLERIAGHLFWTRTMRPGPMYDLSDIEATWEEVQRSMHEVERSFRLDDWPKDENPLCGWCPVLDCEYNRKKAVA